MAKGQVSMEYTAILAAMLVVLIVLILIFSGAYSQQALHEQYQKAQHSTEALASYAKKAWQEGGASQKYVFIEIPESANLSKSFIGNQTISIYINNFGHAFSTTEFNISGRLPPSSGKHLMGLYSNGTHVQISPSANMHLSKPGFYFNSTPDSRLLVITNGGEHSNTISQGLVFPACPACLYNASGTSVLSPGQNITGNLSIPARPAGTYVGYLEINSTNNEGLANKTYTLPITIVEG